MPKALTCANRMSVPHMCRIAVALYSQFGPGKFPATWWPVFGCVVTYILLTLLLNWFCQVYEGEAFLVTSKVCGGVLFTQLQQAAARDGLRVHEDGSCVHDCSGQLAARMAAHHA